tara:strand:- start:55 stop:897 length:843 start_codon:yes stop_codon:yes gene_type:complete
MTIKKYATYNEAVMALLTIAKTKKRSIESLAKETGINRTSMYRWGPKSKHKVSTSSAHSIAQAIGYDIKEQGNYVIITPHTDDDTNRGNDMDLLHKNQQEIIESQRKIISMMEAENERLKKQKSVNEQHREIMFNQIHGDFIASVDLRIDIARLDFGRTITSIDGIERFAQKMGYSVEYCEKKIWALGTSYPSLNEHPVNSYITAETNRNLNSYVKEFFLAMRTIKSILTKEDHLIDIYSDYVAKDGSVVKTRSYNKLNWIDSKNAQVISKVKFIGNDLD